MNRICSLVQVRGRHSLIASQFLTMIWAPVFFPCLADFAFHSSVETGLDITMVGGCRAGVDYDMEPR